MTPNKQTAKSNLQLIREALLIRRVEETFLELFAQGKIHGTVHTSVGQEFSALAFAGNLEKNDYVMSNHRAHGHYLARTKDARGLIAELMGKVSGMCGGVGGSQHLHRDGFFSNGVLGGTVPVAAGLALSNQLKQQGGIGVVFLGDGALGEGVVYETLNIASKWNIRILFACENNFYAQTTPIDVNLAGDIMKRAEAFGIQTYKTDTWHVDALMRTARESIAFVRTQSKPAFVLIDTYRLNPHSKGDDFRGESELAEYRAKDPLIAFQKEFPADFEKLLREVSAEIKQIVNECENAPSLRVSDYLSGPTITQAASQNWSDIKSVDARQVELINQFFVEAMTKDSSIVFLGQDLLPPYGGAFKAAKSLYEKFPGRVFSTPISEAAMVGISNGLALGGFRPFVEIMFGDFVTLAFDQILNYASKFYHMYNKQITCPIVLRVPMGGRRGYGPTHSQTLDKFLIGIDAVSVYALNALVDPREVYEHIRTQERHPVIVIENKTDYGKKLMRKPMDHYRLEQSAGHRFVVRLRPVSSKPTVTVVTYGGMADIVLDSAEALFEQLDLKAEIIVLTKLHPLELNDVIESVRTTRRLFVVEEGSVTGGIGSELIASVIERAKEKIIAKRIGAPPVAIPAAKSLEQAILPGADMIVEAIREALT